MKTKEGGRSACRIFGQLFAISLIKGSAARAISRPKQVKFSV